MPSDRRLAGAASRSMALLGAPGLIVGVVSLASLAFSLLVLSREYDRLRRTGRAAAERAIEVWVRTTAVDGIGRTLADYAESWRSDPSPDRADRLGDALATLGVGLDRQDPHFALVVVEGLTVAARGSSAPIGRWRAERPAAPGLVAMTHRMALLGPGSGGDRAVVLAVDYASSPMAEEALAALEVSYRRLLLAVFGLSGYSLLCLGAMALQAKGLSDRAARESAQEATLELADRTCHELGNIVFVLANERRNLSAHLDQFDRLLAAVPEALDAASASARLDEPSAARLRRAFGRFLADEGLDPEADLRTGSAVARDVARQIAVCSEYIALTVRELDGYLKQSNRPVTPEPVPVVAAIDEALTLLGPRLDAASAVVERPPAEAASLVVRADRRLLVHALVNLLKNALEASASAVPGPRITLAASADGTRVRLAVLDNGPGVPADLRARLFEPGTSTKGPGRGRGLAIARDSIRAQAGTLSVADRPDGGASFVIDLPRADPDEPPR